VSGCQRANKPEWQSLVPPPVSAAALLTQHRRYREPGMPDRPPKRPRLPLRPALAVRSAVEEETARDAARFVRRRQAMARRLARQSRSVEQQIAMGERAQPARGGHGATGGPMLPPTQAAAGLPRFQARTLPRQRAGATDGGAPPARHPEAGITTTSAGACSEDSTDGQREHAPPPNAATRDFAALGGRPSGGGLGGLPARVLVRLLAHLEPRDVLSASSTCRALRKAGSRHHAWFLRALGGLGTPLVCPHGPAYAHDWFRATVAVGKARAGLRRQRAVARQAGAQLIGSRPQRHRTGGGAPAADRPGWPLLPRAGSAGEPGCICPVCGCHAVMAGRAQLTTHVRVSHPELRARPPPDLATAALVRAAVEAPAGREGDRSKARPSAGGRQAEAEEPGAGAAGGEAGAGPAGSAIAALLASLAAAITAGAPLRPSPAGGRRAGTGRLRAPDDALELASAVADGPLSLVDPLTDPVVVLVDARCLRYVSPAVAEAVGMALRVAFSSQGPLRAGASSSAPAGLTTQRMRPPPGFLRVVSGLVAASEAPAAPFPSPLLKLPGEGAGPPPKRRRTRGPGPSRAPFAAPDVLFCALPRTGRRQAAVDVGHTGFSELVLCRMLLPAVLLRHALLLSVAR